MDYAHSSGLGKDASHGGGQFTHIATAESRMSIFWLQGVSVSSAVIPVNTGIHPAKVKAGLDPGSESGVTIIRLA